MNKKPSAIILLGPPGSGKSTLARRLSAGPAVDTIESGGLLRDECRRETALGRKVAPYLEAGELVPTHVVRQVVEQAVTESDAALLIFDGFPRREDQVGPVHQLVDGAGYRLDAVMVLHLAREEAARRLVGRRHCPRCGAVYNIHSNPPQKEGICDRCGAELRRRTDDMPEEVRRRLDVFEEETRPVIEHFIDDAEVRTGVVSAARSMDEVLITVSAILLSIQPAMGAYLAPFGDQPPSGGETTWASALRQGRQRRQRGGGRRDARECTGRR